MCHSIRHRESEFVHFCCILCLPLEKLLFHNNRLPHHKNFPCEKNRGPLKSSFHFYSSFGDECVSSKNIEPLLLMLFLRYSSNFSRFSEAFFPLTLFEIKLLCCFSWYPTFFSIEHKQNFKEFFISLRIFLEMSRDGK